MEPNHQLPEVEVFSVGVFDSDTGYTYNFQTPKYKPEPVDVLALAPLEFILYGLRRVILVCKPQISQQTDEQERQRLSDIVDSALVALPILEHTLREVSVITEKDQKTGSFSYVFRYEFKDRYTLDIQSDKPEGIPPEQRESVLQASAEYIKSVVVAGCIDENIAVRTVLAYYISFHKEKLIKDVKKKGGRSKKQPDTPDKGFFRVSHRLIDEKLKHETPNTKGLGSLFDALLPETQKKIVQSGVDHSAVVEGIRLSATEHRIIDCLCLLLHQRSETSDPASPDYYRGNVKEERKIPFGKIKEVVPQLTFTLYTLTKAFKGGKTISGKDVKNVYGALLELQKKQFLFRYTETTKLKDGKIREREIEEYQPLIQLPTYRERTKDSEGTIIRQTETVLVILHPIFRSQIDSWFITYPVDIGRRTELAFGVGKVTEAVYKLRDYLIRDIHTPRVTTREKNLEDLYLMLCEKWMKEKRKKMVTEAVNRAIETVQRMGLITKHEVSTGKSGQLKVTFHLNKDWQ